MSGTIYLSGPITGMTYKDARYGWRKYLQDILEDGITILSPMRHEGHLAEMQETSIEPDSLPTNLFSHPKLIVSKDFLDIDMCDIMVVNLRGATKPSQGTLIEIGYAVGKGKTIVTIMKEGDKVHNSPFLPVVSSIVVQNLEQAAAIVNSLLSEGI